MPVRLNSSGGGSVTLDVPSTAGTFTATFPANTGNVVTDGATQTLTNKTLTSPALTSPTISGTPVMSASVLTLGTINAGGTNPFPGAGGPTNVDFTSIPSWVRRITVMFFNMSTSGTSNILIRLIHSGSTVVSSGYRSSSARFNDAGLFESDSTAGFLINTQVAANDHYGSYVFTNLSGNIWSGIGSVTYSGGLATSCGGVEIASVLTGIRITTVNGTDTFDAGSINIMYE